MPDEKQKNLAGLASFVATVALSIFGLIACVSPTAGPAAYSDLSFTASDNVLDGDGITLGEKTHSMFTSWHYTCRPSGEAAPDLSLHAVFYANRKDPSLNSGRVSWWEDHTASREGRTFAVIRSGAADWDGPEAVRPQFASAAGSSVSEVKLRFPDIPYVAHDFEHNPAVGFHNGTYALVKAVAYHTQLTKVVPHGLGWRVTDYWGRSVELQVGDLVAQLGNGPGIYRFVPWEAHPFTQEDVPKSKWVIDPSGRALALGPTPGEVVRGYSVEAHADITLHAPPPPNLASVEDRGVYGGTGGELARISESKGVDIEPGQFDVTVSDRVAEQRLRMEIKVRKNGRENEGHENGEFSDCTLTYHAEQYVYRTERASGGPSL